MYLIEKEKNWCLVLDPFSRRVNMRLHELILTAIFVKPGLLNGSKSATLLMSLVSKGTVGIIRLRTDKPANIFLEISSINRLAVTNG